MGGDDDNNEGQVASQLQVFGVHQSALRAGGDGGLGQVGQAKIALLGVNNNSGEIERGSLMRQAPQ